MEVIARKQQGLLGPRIFGIVLGVVLLATGISFVLSDEIEREVAFKVLYLVSTVFLVLIVIEVYQIICILKTPEVIIAKEKDRLLFGKWGTCGISEVREVSYRLSYARHIRYPWGSLTVTVGAKKRTYRYIADVTGVYSAISSLIAEYKKAEAYESDLVVGQQSTAVLDEEAKWKAKNK